MNKITVIRISVISVMLVLYWGLGFYFHAVLGKNIIYSHFAYIPIVISGMWWGRKGITVAVVLGFLTFSFYFTEDISIWSDLIRTFNFVVVALCIGIISEKEKKERKELKLSERRYSHIIEKSLTGIFLYSDEKVIFSNQRFCSLLSCSSEELFGRSIWDIIHPDDAETVRRQIGLRKTSGLQDLHYECRFLTGEDEVRWVDVASSVTLFEGRDAILVNVYDISDRKLIEEEKAQIAEIVQKQEEQLVHSTRLAELGEMAASIAHELNQPLTGIKNFARNAFYMMDQSAGSAEDITDNLRMISEQVDRASRIINQMRELTRKSEQKITRVSLNGVLRGCIEFLSSQFALAGISIAEEFGADIPAVKGDKVRLEQVFLNILTNAKQAMESSRDRKLTVRTFLEAGTGFAVTEISDTGNGFKPEDREKLFVPFYTTKEVGTGTGLGLSISLTIIKDHNGSLEAESSPGNGAVFRIKLPAAADHDGEDK